ncbi:MAG: helix-turn-helix domain-containing protein [Burkholderiales bacterium]|nr:helix-turn-helix domain-containing protein [Burkholderiales bacterium]
MSSPLSQQDPAAASAGDEADESPEIAPVRGERRLERHIGLVARQLRLQQKLTIADVAGEVSISRGMLSKIENGQASASLDTLAKLATVLGVSLAHLFRDYDRKESGAQLIKRDAGMAVVRRGTKRGHTYQLLAYDKGPRKTFEPFLISMDDSSEIFQSFEHPGTEFIYMLQGEIEYRHGQSTYLLQPGDALTFSGNVPHGPEKLIDVPIRFLSIIVYGEHDES